MRPAVWRFGALAIAACWTGKPTPTTIDNRRAEDSHLVGMYFCSIEEGGFAYPQFACSIREIGGRLRLAKLRGSQRFRGVIEPRPDGFAFEGELYCPYGDCTQPLHGVFVRHDNTLRGTFSDARLTVRMIPAPEHAFGGAGYGGDSYGDPYGTHGYDGANEGSNSPP